MNLASKLSDWQKHQLITAEQQQQILDYENNVKRPILFYSLLFLSAFCIGIGFIAVIAANWETIPAAVKLFADFILLIAVAWGIWTLREQGKVLLSEGLIILYALLIMASIGLAGQVYHLPADGLSAVLFWSVLSFPLLLLCTKPFFPGIWLPGFIWSLSDKLYEYSWFERIMDALFSRNYHFAIWLSLWLLSTFYRLIKQLPRPAWQQAWRWWTVTAFVCATVFFDMFNVNALSISHSVGWPYWGAALLLLAALWLSDRKKTYWPATYALAVTWGYSMLGKAFPAAEGMASAAMIIALLAIVSSYAYCTHQTRLFNVATVLIALRLFGIYLEVFGSLLSTGAGLIVSGLVFLGLAGLWQKLRNRLFPKIREKSNV